VALLRDDELLEIDYIDEYYGLQLWRRWL